MNDTETSKQKTSINPERVRNSGSYRSALARSAKVLKKPEKLAKLISEATAKAKRLDHGPLSEIKGNVFSLFRLVKAYSKGDYRQISWSNLVLVVTSIVYFVTPLDLVPDFLLAMGYVDDVAILGWTLRVIGDELTQFTRWEEDREKGHTPIELAED